MKIISNIFITERVKDEHEKFLLTLETPMVIEKEKVMRWHPEFDVESCKEIERAELPQPLETEKATAKEVLGKNIGTKAGEYY